MNTLHATHRGWRAAIMALALAGSASAGAAGAAEAMTSWTPVDDAALAALTGGFRESNGVTVAFAIDVEALLNGVPVAPKASSTGAFTLVPQSVKGAMTSSGALTLILRNSADGQALQVRTVLNIGLTELGAVHALQTQRLVSPWQMVSLRP